PSSAPPLQLHSFPTRRSSDLAARCVPGVASVRPNGKDRYQGTLAVQIGPVRLVLDGDFAIVARDETAGTASIRADAKDSRVGGADRKSTRLNSSHRTISYAVF